MESESGARRRRSSTLAACRKQSAVPARMKPYRFCANCGRVSRRTTRESFFVFQRRGKALPLRARVARPFGWAAGAKPRKDAPLLYGMATCPICFPHRAMREGLNRIRRCAAERGRVLEDPRKPWTPVLHLFVNLHEKEDKALDDGTRNLSMRYGSNMREAAKKYLLHGPLERCADVIRAFSKVGVRHFIFKTAAPAHEEVDHMARLTEELLPVVRRHVG